MTDKERNNLAYEKEILFRGKIMKSTALIEMIITRLILVSNFSNPIDELIKLKGVNITQKMAKASELLDKFHPEFYIKSRPIFNRYNGLKEFRNRIAHCTFIWNEPDLMAFGIWDMVSEKEGKDDIHYFKLFRLTVAECLDKIKEFDAITVDFLNFIIELEDSLGQPFQDFLERPIPPNS